MRLHTQVAARLKEHCTNIILVIATIVSIASVAEGYANIRAAQVEQAMKLENVEARITRVESKLDKFFGFTYEGASTEP